MRQTIKQADSTEYIRITSRAESKTYLPIAFDVADMKCLIAGGGTVAFRKAKTLVKAGASVTVVSPVVCEQLQDLVINNQISWIVKRYKPELLEVYGFIVAATSDKQLNINIANDAQKLSKLYCVVSSGKHSQVIFPAVYNKGNVNVAVHSNGINCRYSKALRNRIVSLIEDPCKDKKQLLMFGFNKSKISSEVFNELKVYEKKLINNNSWQGELLILSTCCRWECYINSRSARQLIREVLSGIKELFSSHWICLETAIEYKSGHAVYFHLLNICLGLDSYLIGESEIVSQVKSSVSRWLENDDAELAEIFSSALLAARKIKQSNIFTLSGNDWPGSIVSIIKNSNITKDERKILVIGNGCLSGKIINRLRNSNYRCIKFSRHLEDADKHSSGLYHTDRLGDFLYEASAMIICSQLTTQALTALTSRKDNSGLVIIDLAEQSGLVKVASDNASYYDLADIAKHNISASETESFANIRFKAIEQSLIWHTIQNPPRSPSGPIRIGARRSRLSKKQVIEVEYLLKTLDENINLEKIFLDVPCDRDRATPLQNVSQDDFFTRDLDKALIAGEIDIAIHSAKDLPQNIQHNLEIAAVTASLAPYDCLISKDNIPLMSLPRKATVATSSITRRENLARIRPELQPVDVRGNIPNRIEQLNNGKFDALIAASIGLIRLGMTDRITEILPEKTFPVTPGQGSLALVMRRSDTELLDFLKPLDLGR